MPSTRQLAAIMFTDIVGYTALMGKDEQKAFELLKKNRQIQKPIIEQFNGRWIKELGDGVMASFNTVSDAVNAAIKIQEACNTAKDFQLRIGIHLGEVVFENDDVFGDGVNIASRIQALAPPGGIWVSESVHNNVSNKKDIRTEFIKEETLKNVKEPVRIYKVSMEGFGTESTPALFTQKDLEKSIAVLPFVNMSNDPDQEYFSDGLTEELITSLSRLKDIRVVSRTTSMQYKGTKKDIKTIGRELSVSYILEGSVRKFHDNLRITAQFIDVENDAHLWAETYKGTLADVFDIQEQVSKKIVDALMITLSPKEKVRLTKRSTLNVEAYDCYLRARNFLYRLTKNDIQFAIQLFQKAIKLDPGFAGAYAGLGEAYATFYQEFERKEILLEKAIESSLKALMYDSTLSEAYAALGLAYFNKGLLDEALTACQKAIALDENNFIGYWILGRIYQTKVRDNEALEMYKKVVSLNPDFYTVRFGYTLTVYERLGDVENYNKTVQEAMVFYPQYLSENPDDARAHMFYGIDLTRAGRVAEGRIQAARALELRPGDPLMMYVGACFYARLGEKRFALEYLKNALAAGYAHYEWFKWDPDFENIRNEPEYIELMKGK